MSETLPPDTIIQTHGNREGMRISISMTISSPDHARALITALEKAIIPLLLEIDFARASQAAEVAASEYENPRPVGEE